MDVIKRINFEIKKFVDYKESVKLKKEFYFKEIDQYGFSIGPTSQNRDTIDFLLGGLTHGNEVIGLEVINLVLQKIDHMNLPFRVGFLLNNVDAAVENQRYLDRDLNRSFNYNEAVDKESIRADQIEKVLPQCKFVLDLHQTVEPTETSFFIFPFNEKLIRMAKAFDSESEIATFSSGGFSKDGATLVEYAFDLKIPAFVIEISQNGFDTVMANRFAQLIYNNLFKMNEILNSAASKITYYQMQDFVPNSKEDKSNLGLKLGVYNFMHFKPHEKLTENFQTSFEGVVLFPKYNKMTEHSHELAQLAIKKVLE